MLLTGVGGNWKNKYVVVKIFIMKTCTFSEPFYSPDWVWAWAVDPGEELLKAPAVMDWVQALGVWGLLGTSG